MFSRAMALVGAMAVGLTTLAIGIAPPAQAVVLNDFTVDYDKVVFGEFIVAGNTVISCPGTAPAGQVIGNVAACEAGRVTDSSALTTASINDVFYMNYVDVDGDPTTWNSSTARINIPAGATIDYARLWWAGNNGNAVKANGANWFACNASQPNTATPNQADAPPGFADVPVDTQIQPIKLKINGGTYQSLTAQRFTQDNRTNSGQAFAASYDVKSIITAAGTGTLDLTVGNIWTPRGNNCLGGWEIAVVWKFNDPNPTFAPTPRQVVLFDGFVSQGRADAPTTTTLTGFSLLNGTKRLGVGVLEGDHGITGDQLIARGVVLTEPRLAPAIQTNFMASTADGALNPAYRNTYGIDAKTMTVPDSVLPAGTTSVPITFTTSGDQYYPYMFAFSAPVLTSFISGTVWNDINGDGIIDSGEAPLAGITITLTGTDMNGQPVTRTAVTDASGAYRFDGLLNGTYTVTETQPTSYANSPGTPATVRTPLVISGSAPMGITQQNFGEQLGGISGFVYLDANASNVKDGGDTAIGSVTINLTGTDINGNPISRTTTTSAVDGSYSFTQLPAGTYTVYEVQPPVYGDGAETAGSLGGSTATNDQIQAIVLPAGGSSAGNNFGEKITGLSGTVYVDADNDGVIDLGELKVQGATITLTGTTEAGVPVTLTTLTLADGTYSFPNLKPGTYTVTETQPITWGDGIDSTGTVGGTPAGTTTNDQTATVVLTGAGAGVNYNFGERPATVSGTVWYDADADSVLDPAEAARLAGVTVTLTGTDASGVAVNMTTTTDVNGNYSFTNVPAGTNYTITETQPTGYGSSLNGTAITGLAVPAGGAVINQNFGETLGSISGKVYVDSTDNNNYDVAEAGISGVTVTLTGTDASGNSITRTTTTDASGSYTFAGVPAGTYRVAETQPAGFTDDTEDAGTAGGTANPGAVNDVIGAISGASAINLGAGVNATGYNFGEVGSSISGKVWVDVDNDGVVDAVEPGIPGVTLLLETLVCQGNVTGSWYFPMTTSPFGCPTFIAQEFGGNSTATWVVLSTGIPTVVTTVITDASGNYTFGGLFPQFTYRVKETQPTNYSDGTAVGGTNGSVTTQAPTEVIQIGTNSFSTVLGAGGSVNNNFGELAGEISGYVFVDDENDASRTGDTPLAGVKVTATDGTTTWTAYTDATGFYQFVGLPLTGGSRTYTITETQPTTHLDGQDTTPATAPVSSVTGNDVISVTLTTANRVETENNFGERPASLSGTVWHDADKDGILDGTEAGRIDTTVSLYDSGGNFITSTTTGPDGTYEFTGLALGNYTVVETQPTGYGSSTPNTINVVLDQLVETGYDFGETLGSLAGSVYADLNRNGVWDSGEPPLVGVDVTLTSTDPGFVPVIIQTDGAGNYLFTDLFAGTYTVTEPTQPAAYADGTETVGTTGGTDTATDEINAIALDGGEDATGYLFGEIPAFVEGTVYYDKDRNGAQDDPSVDTPIGGVIVQLWSADGTTKLFETTTDIDGHYAFPEVPAGDYLVREIQPPGYGSSETPTNEIAISVPTSGLTDQDFGDTLSSLAGTVYIDINNNGVQDIGENGIAGATVTVGGTTVGGEPVLVVVTTDSSGNYLFEDLKAGTYGIDESQPVGFDDGLDQIGSEGGDQLAEAAPDTLGNIDLGIEVDGTDYDFGEIGTTIAGTVYYDVDKDGVYDPMIDTPLEGVTVTLYAADGTTVVETLITGPDGTYLFDNLPIGDYVVEETQPAGYGDTTGDDGVNRQDVAAPAGGIGGIDFGDTRSSITGRVEADVDNDGQTASDIGIPGVTVTLTGTDADGPVNLTTTTKPDGTYEFLGLLAGTYTVTETQPAGWADDDDYVGTAAGTAGNDVTSTISLGVGVDATGYDFSERGAAILGVVYFDRDRDGVQDPDEPGIPGVTVTLDDGNPSTVDPTMITDVNGAYVFAGLSAGDYTVVESQPGGYGSSDPSFVEGPNSRPVTVVPDQVATINFADTLSTISGTVYADANNDGVRDAGELPIDGVTLTLEGIDANGDPVLLTTTTDASGYYEFVDLKSSDVEGYTLTETDPANYDDGLDAVGSVDGTPEGNLAADTLDDYIDSIVLDVGVDGIEYNFGEIGVELNGTVWLDTDGDGAIDPTETGLGGVLITVLDAAGNVLATTTTNPDGTYEIIGLPCCEPLTVVETQPSLYSTLSPNEVEVTIPSGGVSTVDFAEKGGLLQGTVWLDKDNDNIRDIDSLDNFIDVGIGGVTVTLTGIDADGNPVSDSTVTAADGSFVFADLPAGEYTITETHPIRYGDSLDFDGTLGGGTVVNDEISTIVVDPGDAGTVYDYSEVGAKVSGTVWLDPSDDGVIDGGETVRLEGVTIVLDDGDPLTADPTTTTDEFGYYEFTGVPTGDYTIRETQPTGYGSTTDDDIPITVALDGAGVPVDVVDQNFGEILGTVGDTVFNDLDGDGVQGANEPGIPGVSLRLDDGDGDLTNDQVVTTDAAGHYMFVNVAFGTYTVAADTSTLPPGMLATADFDDPFDDDTSTPLTTPNASEVTISAGNLNDTLQDFGYQGPGVIGDFIWNDLDSDGVQDPGEPGIAGVTVTITTEIDGETVTYTTVTDESGEYVVSGLPLGTFTVTVDPASLPAEMVPTSDPDGVADHTADVVLGLGTEQNLDQDFGYAGPGSIGDTVFNDLNGDGDQDSGEPGIPGVTVTLTGLLNGEPATWTTTTGADGTYSFPGLSFAAYDVTVDDGTLPAGLLPTGDADDPSDGFILTSPTTAHTSAIELTLAAPTSDVQDFGYQGPGAIGDTIFVDQNGDGIQNDGEPGIPGVVVTLTTVIDGVDVVYSATTNADGLYAVQGLPLGEYTVAVDDSTLPEGVQPTGDDDDAADGNLDTPLTTPHQSVVTLTAGAGAVDVDQDFGYQGPGEIGDTLFIDVNGNGSLDAGEPGIPGVTVEVEVTINGLPVVFSAVTDAFGEYSFTGLPLGTYTVVVDPDGDTLPIELINTVDPDGGADETSQVTLTAGAAAVNLDQDFGYEGPGSIGDFVWNDVNGDGNQDLGEPGIPGVEVTVTVEINGEPITYTTTTGADGSYLIENLPFGDFTVSVATDTLPAEMVTTFDADGGDDNQSQVTLTVTSHEVDDAQDFGYAGPGVIGDRVWNDVDGDGVQDAGEPGVPGVTVTLTTGVTMPDSTTATITWTAVTGADGAYEFVGLPVEQTYTVTIDELTLPGGMLPTADADDPSDDDIATAPVTAHASVIELTSAEPTNDLQDFGYQGPGELGDRVWIDTNGDGVQDLGEPGLPGVTVTITAEITMPDASIETMTWTTVTGADGAYSFTGLPVDVTYTVVVTPIPGTTQTGGPLGGTGVDPLDNTATVELTTALPTSDVQDFGYEGPGSIGDTIFNDLNGDGDQDADEPGIPGVSVTLTATIAGQTVSVSVVTDASGNYLASGLPYGTYDVDVDETTLPGTMTQTAGPLGATDPHDGTSNLTIDATTPEDLDQDFGYQGAGRIGDTVFNDLDGDGTQDANEPGIPGVDLTITTEIAGETVTYTTTTDENGEYDLSGLPTGTYVVAVETDSLPGGMLPTGDADDAADGALESANQSTVVLDDAVPENLDQDFGYEGPGSIGDFVWNDQNGDGVQDAGEPGLPGVTVTITATIDGDLVTWTTQTDAVGAYSVIGLPYGSYSVTVDDTTLPGGVLPTADFDDPSDDDIATPPATPHVSEIELTSAAPSSDVQDFGYQGPGEIGDTIFNDRDGDGIQGADEPGIPGIVVTLTTVIDGADVVYTATTDADGVYRVIGLPLGEYTVVVDDSLLPGGMQPTGDDDDAADGNLDTPLTTPHQSVVTLTAGVGAVDLDQDFGYQGPGEIGDLLFIDVNGNGSLDAGEPGIPSVTVEVEITINGEVVTYSTVTDEFGEYSFTGLPLGTYTVNVDPAGDTLPVELANTVDPDGGADETSQVTLTAGAAAVNIDQDFGYEGPGSIGDTVWFDLNEDGIKDATEPGIPGVEITVTVEINGEPITYTTTTGADGSYLIENLPYGTYTVTVDTATLPDGVSPVFDFDGGEDNTSTITLDVAHPADTDQDFGYLGIGEIGDVVWNDLDGDGAQDADEPGLPGVTLTATTTIDGAPVTFTTVTGPLGEYLFEGLPVEQTFDVVVDTATLTPGLLPTADADDVSDNDLATAPPVSPNGSRIELTMTDPTDDVQDFGYQGPGSIGDFIWVDVNQDGVQDAGEPGIPGLTVTITTSIGGETVTYTTTTDGDGGYDIAGLPLGDFTVEVTPIPGMTQTSGPLGIVGTDPLDNTSTVTLGDPQPVTNDAQDFGYFGPGVIGDTIFNDLNGDGDQDADEPGIPGVSLTLTALIDGAEVSFTVITDANGEYLAVGLPLGTYDITIDPATLPGGLDQTAGPLGGVDPLDGSATVTVDETTPENLDQDFGFQGAASIGDTVFNDQNGNGTQDSGEPGIPGVTITITAEIGGETVTWSTQTDANGDYTISGLPYEEFTVTVDTTTLPGGVLPTADADGPTDNAYGTPPATPNSSVVVLDATHETDDLQDFGYEGPGSIGDFVWNDINADGVQDLGEPGLPGVDIVITTIVNGETVTYTTTTGADGDYDVSGLPLGEYTVSVDPTSTPAIASMTQSFDHDGLGAGSANTSTIELTDLAPIADLEDFGYVGEGAIGDTIWLDLNGDGVQDANEPGIPGVTVSLILDEGLPSEVTWIRVTDGSGGYLFGDLPEGDFTIRVDTATLPAELGLTGDPDGADDSESVATLDFSGDPGTSGTSASEDFGYAGPGEIGDTVFNDLDGDGVQGPDEPGIPGVEITIATEINGLPVEITVVTDENGEYLVTGLPYGDYTVTVNSDTLPDGVLPTADSDDISDDDITTVPLTPHTSALTLSDISPTSDAQDFGYQGPGEIGDTVFNDIDGDGIQGTDEPGLPGVEITITTEIAGEVVTYTTTTGPDGTYSISGLPLGDFTVTIVPATLPDGVDPTADGDDPADGSLETPRTSDVTLTADVPVDSDQDFAEQGPGTISDLIWNDQDGDGVQDAGEPGIPGVIVNITAQINGTLVTWTTTTDENGHYEISGLPLGEFTVTPDPTTLPLGLDPTFDSDDPADGDLATPGSSTVTLTDADPTSDAQDFGYQGPGSIGDFVWSDLDGDGNQDPGEPGLPGVTITVTTEIAGNTVTYTATTDENGAYLIDGLPYGDYEISAPLTQPGALDITTPELVTATLNDAAPAFEAGDFGYQGPGAIGDTIFNDQNGNGTQDLGEPGLPGIDVVVTTEIAGEVVTYTVTTDPDGHYELSGLPLGDFVVTVDPATLPDGVEVTGDPDGIDDGTTEVTLDVAAPTSDVEDFGYQGPGVIGDTVFNDQNANGIQDPDEPGMPGVTIIVTTEINGEEVTWTTVTAPDGTYEISGLPLGEFTVSVDPDSLAPGLEPTSDLDDPIDPDAPPAPPVTPHVTLVTLTDAAPTSDVADFGYTGPGEIGDLVWDDLNGDGLQDPDEPGIPGVTITVTTEIAGETVTYTTTTDPDGVYSVPGLPLGDYEVSIDPTDLPDGAVPTEDRDGVETPWVTSEVSITDIEPIVDDADFGTFTPVSLGDTIWDDLDGDGIQDAGEPGISGVTVTLVGTDGLGNEVALEAITDENGNYLFEDLAPGEYELTVEFPDGMEPTAPEQGTDPELDSDGPVVSIVLTSGTDRLDIDAGAFTPVPVSGVVYFDANGNGVQDATEPGIAGATMTLTGTTGDGDPVSVVVTTGVDGTYVFEGVDPGVYTVTETQPTNFTDGAENPPTGATTPSNDVIAITVTSGTPITDVTFGELGWPVSGAVFIDSTNTPIPGVTLTLTGTDIFGHPVTATTVTGTCGTGPSWTMFTCGVGSYLFENLPPGDYVITETQPVGFAGGAVQSDNVIEVALVAAPVPGNDFSEKASVITGVVFVDTNRDGVKDPNEFPVPDVQVILTGIDETGKAVEIKVVTNANGEFRFVDLRAGDYTINETQPIGLRDVSSSAGSAGGSPFGNSIMSIRVAAGTTNTDYRFGEISGGALPKTGLMIGGTLGAGALLAGAGLALMMLGRRRRNLAD